MLEKILSISSILFVIGSIWVFLFGKMDYPYFYSLPIKEKLLSRYLPLMLAVIGIIGFIISIMCMLILAVIENIK